MTYSCKYTVKAYTSPKHWSICAHDTMEQAVRYAMRRIRKLHGTVKIYNCDELIWQRG